MRAHEALLAGDPLHPPGWKRKDPHSGSPAKKKKYLKPLPKRVRMDDKAPDNFDESLAVEEDEKDRLITDKFTGGSRAYKNQLKDVQKSIDQDN